MKTTEELVAGYTAAAKTKTSFAWYKLLVLAALAGSFIALAGALATAAGVGFSGTQAALIKGAVFPLGLILVVICGGELFTGNCLLIAPLIDRKIKPTGMLKNWGIAYIGNFIGATLIAVLVVFSHAGGEPFAVASVTAAAAKCNTPFGYTLLRGILCNMLVCLAVWGATASSSAAGKILAVYMPVFAFVVCGFEHSIANMYYITSGLMASAEFGLPFSGLDFGNGLLYSLIPSTLGNIIGGALIAGAYYLAYFKKPLAKAISALDDASSVAREAAASSDENAETEKTEKSELGRETE